MTDAVRERISQEVVRRAEAHTFNHVTWDRVIRSQLPNVDDKAGGSTLAVLEFAEEYDYQNTLTAAKGTLTLDFAVSIGPDEQPATIVNNVSAELIALLTRNPKLVEGGDDSGGQRLTHNIKATMADPDPYASTEQARGSVELVVEYRTALHDFFTLRG